MGQIITLKNGEQKSILNMSDVMDIVAFHLGTEITDCITSEFAEWEAELEYANDVKKDYEDECGRYATAICKAQTELELTLKKLTNFKGNIAPTMQKEYSSLLDEISQVRDLLEET